MKYETYVEQHILAPLGMSNSTFEYNAELRAKMVTALNHICLYEDRQLEVLNSVMEQ